MPGSRQVQRDKPGCDPHNKLLVLWHWLHCPNRISRHASGIRCLLLPVGSSASVVVILLLHAIIFAAASTDTATVATAAAAAAAASRLREIHCSHNSACRQSSSIRAPAPEPSLHHLPLVDRVRGPRTSRHPHTKLLRLPCYGRREIPTPKQPNTASNS